MEQTKCTDCEKEATTSYDLCDDCFLAFEYKCRKEWDEAVARGEDPYCSAAPVYTPWGEKW